MKTFISLTLGLLCALSTYGTASAQVYYSYNNGYNNTYQNTQQASYTYTQGCYTYYYNGYTRSTSIIGSTCQSQNVYSYTTPVSYTYTTSPTYTYTTSPSYTYTTPTSYTNQTSPYYVYGYERSNATWYPRYNNSYFFNGDSSYNSYDSTFVPTPRTYCYTINGYSVCQ